MDAFENVMASILERHGFWVRTTFKVELTREDKVAIGRRSSPRWELDVIAYCPGDNLLRVVECKSYLNSRGVVRAAFEPVANRPSRFKLFTDAGLREVVLRRLVAQLTAERLIRKSPVVELCLAAGNIPTSEVPKVQEHFDANEWRLFTPDWIRDELRELSKSGYDNEIAAVTAKLLLRKG